MERVVRHRKHYKDTFRTVTQNTSLEDLPLSYAKSLRNSRELGDMRFQGLDLIRSWDEYVSKHDIGTDDPFMLRHHISQFAAETFTAEYRVTPLISVPIDTLSQNGIAYEDLVQPLTHKSILHDEAIAVVGGAARTALKMHAGIPVDAEMPLADIDIAISSGVDIRQKADYYHIDLSGTKIVNHAIEDCLPSMVTQVDCTMNQAVIHNKQLFYTEQAFEDIQNGIIRITAKHDSLFGSEGYRLSNGNVYLNRSGFYRGLAFLLRGKGDELVVSKENIAAEAESIGRYWPILLNVKLLTMHDEDARYEAIGHWHDIAQRMGATEATSPIAFLRENKAKYPEMRNYNSTDGSFDTQAQVRWLIGKLTSRAVDHMMGEEIVWMPDTYTPAHLRRSDRVPDYDYDAFMKEVSE